MTEKIAGLQYGLTATDGEETLITFCHKINAEFKNGVTDEELVEVLIARYMYHLGRVDNQANNQIYIFLRQIKMIMKNRKLRKPVNLDSDVNNDPGHSL